MRASLNLRDIGEHRKAALKNEADARGVSVSEIVRDWIDRGIAQAKAERARAEWIKAAQTGLVEEALHLERHGPTLARFRRVGTAER